MYSLFITIHRTDRSWMYSLLITIHRTDRSGMYSFFITVHRIASGELVIKYNTFWPPRSKTWEKTTRVIVHSAIDMANAGLILPRDFGQHSFFLPVTQHATFALPQLDSVIICLSLGHEGRQTWGGKGHLLVIWSVKPFRRTHFCSKYPHYDNYIQIYNKPLNTCTRDTMSKENTTHNSLMI